jgi:hypothetical protein
LAKRAGHQPEIPEQPKTVRIDRKSSKIKRIKHCTAGGLSAHARQSAEVCFKVNRRELSQRMARESSEIVRNATKKALDLLGFDATQTGISKETMEDSERCVSNSRPSR